MTHPRLADDHHIAVAVSRDWHDAAVPPHQLSPAVSWIAPAQAVFVDDDEPLLQRQQSIRFDRVRP